MREREIPISLAGRAADMSDGLPEMTGPGGDVLGYEGTRELFLQAAPHPSDEALAQLFEAVNGSLSLNGLGGDVKAELVNGRATARDLAGNVEISTVNGSLDVALTELGTDQTIELESVNGSLDLAVPSYADAEIRAETVHGRIRNDFGLEEEKDEYVGSSLSGTLGRGGARVELENVNGSIHIRQGS